MKIFKGRNAGDGYELHQYANDWMTADGHGHENLVVKPLNVQLSKAERERLLADRERNGELRYGMFWQHWELHEDGTFTPRKH